MVTPIGQSRQERNERRYQSIEAVCTFYTTPHQHTLQSMPTAESARSPFLAVRNGHGFLEQQVFRCGFISTVLRNVVQNSCFLDGCVGDFSIMAYDVWTSRLFYRIRLDAESTSSTQVPVRGGLCEQAPSTRAATNEARRREHVALYKLMADAGGSDRWVGPARLVEVDVLMLESEGQSSPGTLRGPSFLIERLDNVVGRLSRCALSMHCPRMIKLATNGGEGQREID